ncbi:MAG: translesion error-prone DNA polymerase V autoproteolytic subunit [Ignavibacteriaceae bacterium]
MKISEPIPFEEINVQKLPLFSSSVSAGFRSPAEDYIEKKLDLNELLIKHPSATFFVRVDGNSMINAGINSGDILIVDRALEPTNNKVVVAVVNGEFTVKRIKKNKEKIFLFPDNPDYPLIEVTLEMDFSIWGVVSYVIHDPS